MITYLNFKLKKVLNEDISLVMMNEEINEQSLSRFIEDTIRFFRSRPDEYIVINDKIEKIKITYDNKYNIYNVYIK